MMEKSSDDPVNDSAEIDTENLELKHSGSAGGAAATSEACHDSVSDDTFDDLAELGVHPQHNWRKDARHSASSAGAAGSPDIPTSLRRASSGAMSSSSRRSGASAASGRLSPTKDDMIKAEYDAEIVEAISSDVEDSDYYTSGSEDEYSDSDTDAVVYASDTDAIASMDSQDRSEEKSAAAPSDGAPATETAAETKKKKKDKKKKKKEKKAKRSSKRSSTSTRGNRSVDGSTRSARTTNDKKKKRKSRTSGTSKVVAAENDAQKELILKLQNQLSEALHKVVTTTEEHIHDKNRFLIVSTELAELKGQVIALTKVRDDTQTNIEMKEATISEQGTLISKLEGAVERQLDLQEDLESKLDRSEEEINKLLEDIEELEKQQLEASAAGGEGAGGAVQATSRALQAELDKCKAQLEEKDKQLQEYKAAVAELEKDLEEGHTINRLQINEMEETNISLQGKLKAERLEVARKLDQKDETISELQQEIDNYKRTDDVQDLVVAREKLNETRIELDETRTAKEAAMNDVAALTGEKEDLLEKLNVLTTQATTLRQDNKDLEAKSKKSHLQVLEWTEKTYDWKSRAEAAEKKLQAEGNEKDPSGDEAPQGSFLQAIMDNQAAKQQQQRASTGANLRRSVQGWFGKASDEGGSTEDYDSDAPAEQIRIQKLEEHNSSLDATVAQLRSEIVKLQSSHKEKLYSLKKEMEVVSGENEALRRKNMTLEQLSN
ncbi:MAG: hypothetical protein SGBAC_003837 [Bacillariaceae sp.]